MPDDPSAARVPRTSTAVRDRASDDPGRALRRKALDLLARREHSPLELRRKLRTGSGDPTLIDEVVGALVAERLVSAERFAAALVRNRIERGWGPLRIRAELRERGIDDEVAGAHLEAGDDVWIERARAARQRRFGSSPPRDRKDEARQVRFLAARGFTRAQIGAAMRAERSVAGE